VFQIELTGSNKLKVKAGDHLGFSWTNGGVVCYGDAGSVLGKYCADDTVPNLGDTVTTFQKGETTNRDYAIRARYAPDEEGMIIGSILK
jgi:hypothetical protein